MNPQTNKYFESIDELVNWKGDVLLRMHYSRYLLKDNENKVKTEYYHLTSKNIKLFKDERLSKSAYWFDELHHLDDNTIRYFGIISNKEEQSELLKVLSKDYHMFSKKERRTSKEEDSSIFGKIEKFIGP